MVRFGFSMYEVSVISRLMLDPQRAVGISVHCPHFVGQQSLRGGEGDDFPLRDAAQTICRPDPEIAFAILEKRRHGPVADADRLRGEVETFVAEAADTVVQSADPQCAVAVFVKGADVRGRKSISRR